MGTQNSKERYLELWEQLEKGIENNYGGSLRKFAQDYFDRAPDNEYERDNEKQFELFYGHLKHLRQRKDTYKSANPLTIEKMEKYCLFLEEGLYFHSMLDDEYILID